MELPTNLANDFQKQQQYKWSDEKKNEYLSKLHQSHLCLLNTNADVNNIAGICPVVGMFSVASLAISSFLGVIWSASFSFLHFLLNFGPSEPSTSQELITHYNFLPSTLSGWPDMH